MFVCGGGALTELLNCSMVYFNPTSVFFQIDFGLNQVLLPTCSGPTWPSTNGAESGEFVQ